MLDKIPHDLLNAFQHKNLIPIIGAGVSMSLTDDAGAKVFPSWGELLGHAASELILEDNEEHANGIISMLGLKRYKLAAQLAREGLQGKLWSQFFKKHFNEPASRVSEDSMALPKAIWGLSNRVLTLNYDKVMRWACPEQRSFVELDNDNNAGLVDFTRRDHADPIIWHFHGRVDNISTVIFTDESYDKLYAENNESYKAALEVFRGICRDQQLLFIGCSLDDAELLHEISKQHQLFDGNTGPHYALVRQDQHDAIKQKIAGLPVKLLTVESFGNPLVELVNAIANHVPQQLESAQVADPQPAVLQQPLNKDRGKKIALLSASPLDEEQHYTGLLKEFRKIACHIDHFSLNIDNLNNLQGYDYLLILTKVIKNKLLIEDDHLCSRRISFKELEEHIGNVSTAGIFIFVDQLPDLTATAEIDLPTLILPDLDKKQIDSAVFQLFKKNNLDYFENSLLLNRPAFILCPLTEKITSDNNIRQQRTPLPDSIDPKTVRKFVGRTGDLEQISRKLMTLEEEGGVLTIKGSGGIGKTSTVKKIAVALAERGCFLGGIYFVDCEPITDCQQFKYKVSASFNLEQAEDLKQHLRDHHDHQPRLILLDNFETLLYLNDAKDVKDVLSMICDYATIVITSRERLQVEGEVVYEMRQFTTDEAVELFKSCLDREISPDELALLRQDIIENLLDNNPLAIKLITGNMPKGKSFAALKEELETDLFSKISDSELKVFDDSSDLNIARKKSIYGSILYSYNHLLDNEKRAFELLSLFPDGIGLEIFKKLTQGQRDSKGSGKGGLHQTMITDIVIKALENKSMLENNSGLIKLQSIVGKFAEAQLHRRDSLAHYYHNAFVYNRTLAKSLKNIKNENEKRALVIFNSQQGNFLKSISYCDKIDCDRIELITYLEDLLILFIEICSLKGFIRELSARVDYFQERDRQAVDSHLLQARYFDGDFERAFTGIKQIVPLERLVTLDRALPIERTLADMVTNIYSMEGDALFIAKYDSKNSLIMNDYPSTLFALGEYNQQLVENSKHDFFSMEVMANMGLPVIDEINSYLLGLYDKAHLERMQASYTRSKLNPFERDEIEALVTVNPYTRGIKGLMLAFIETDVIKAGELYQESIAQLSHIKYFYVEALFFYAKFLQVHNARNFDSLYSLGLNLAKKHHYRFLQYCFEQLLHPTGVTYDHRNYSLPDNEDFTEYIQLLINDKNKHKGKK